MKELSLLFLTIPKLSILNVIGLEIFEFKIPCANLWPYSDHVFSNQIFQLFIRIKIDHFGIIRKGRLAFFIYIGFIIGFADNIGWKWYNHNVEYSRIDAICSTFSSVQTRKDFTFIFSIRFKGKWTYCHTPHMIWVAPLPRIF